MEGQWRGSFTGTISGELLIDLDDAGDHWRGHAFAFAADTEGPNVLVRIRTPDKKPTQSLKIAEQDISFLHPLEPIVLDKNSLSESFALARTINLTIRAAATSMKLSWDADNDSHGAGEANLSAAQEDSEYNVRADIRTWSEFRDYALNLPSRRYIFRGQDCSKRLRTTFHRTRRKDLVEFLRTDIPNAHHTLTARTRHMFDLMKPVENAAFLNLLQHHGYPTPLLDWSYSPFVAAFFAYRFRRERRKGDDTVRIFVFNKEEWMADFAQVQSLTFARPHFSILEALTIENLRAMPQQALSSLTNLDDIERHIRELEQLSGKTYLEVIDLPFADRRSVMEQLSMMGITAGSLFPGLDGACEELKGRYFHPLN